MKKQSPDLRRKVCLLRLLLLAVFLSLIDGVGFLPGYQNTMGCFSEYITDQWRRMTYWWKYKRTAWIRHQICMLARDRTVLSHDEELCDSLGQCPFYHWRPDPQWTLIEYFDMPILYAVLKYKPSGRFFPAVEYARANEDPWMRDEIDQEKFFLAVEASGGRGRHTKRVGNLMER